MRALVIGTGWAGDGHTTALQAIGVEVAVVAGRSAERAGDFAARHGVHASSGDWRRALDDHQPDIVSIATIAPPHCDIAVTAAQAGAHVVCDKPLGINAAEAKKMLHAAESAGVKHAYAATACFSPAYQHAARLVADGQIGTPWEFELDAPYAPLLDTFPFSWAHRTDLGGGLLNTFFTHQLEVARVTTGGAPTRVAGSATRLLAEVPDRPPVHDLREWAEAGPLTEEERKELPRQRADTDRGYMALVEFGLSGGPTFNGLFRHSNGPRDAEHRVAVVGERASLAASDNGTTLRRCERGSEAWVDVEVRAVTGNLAQENWNELFRRFVAHATGNSAASDPSVDGYPTFANGHDCCRIMDAIRAGAPVDLSPNRWTPR